jgi:hypothetical protein
MKTTNMFYPNFLVWLFTGFFDWADVSPWGGLYSALIILFSPILIVLLPPWYILDVISNVWDWVCIRVFVWFPLYGMNKMEEMERLMP